MGLIKEGEHRLEPATDKVDGSARSLAREFRPRAAATELNPRRHRGRPAKLSRESIIHAALDLLDEVSVDAA